jgi:hypothetical protein
MNKIEEILNSLDGIQKADPKPFLATRVKASLQQKITIWDRVITNITKPIFVLTSIMVLLALNVFIVLQNKNIESESTLVNEEELVQNDYATNTFYTIENNNDDEK